MENNKDSGIDRLPLQFSLTIILQNINQRELFGNQTVSLGFVWYWVGGFLVSNSHEDQPDDGQEFQASEKFSLFQKEFQRSRKKGYKLFGVNMAPETIAIAMVYFVQGILGLSRLAVSFFLKDNLHLDPAEVSDV
jgi:hypothetical protein